MSVVSRVHRALFVAAVVMAGMASSRALSPEATQFLVSQEWEAFKTKFSKAYDTAEEEAERLQIFQENLEKMAAWNKENNVFGVSKFADMTQEEFAAKYLNHRPSGSPRDQEVYHNRVRVSTPSSFDWRDQGDYVTPVKDQGQCGSCWAFSATEAIESAWAIAGNGLSEFAPEQIVQCDSGAYGCNGGWTESAFDYVKSAGGMALESDYPYTSGTAGVTGTCSSDFTVSGGTITGYNYATDPCTSAFCNNQDEATMAQNLYTEKPLAVCADASQWYLYTGGVMTSSSCSSSYFKQDHCIYAAGFQDIDSSSGYWLIRNSWNTDWGEDGYIYLAYGDNTCGIANDANFPLV